MLAEYVEKQPEALQQDGTRVVPKHPLGERKVLVERLFDVKDDHPLKQPFDHLKSLATDALDIILGSYKNKYKETAPDSAWKFNLTFSALAPESVKSAPYSSIKYTTKADSPPATFDVRRERLSQAEQELWTQPKTMPRKPRPGGRAGQRGRRRRCPCRGSRRRWGGAQRHPEGPVGALGHMSGGLPHGASATLATPPPAARSTAWFRRRSSPMGCSPRGFV